MKIRYVGNKPFKRDTVAGTGLIWEPGDIHEVEDGRAAVLLQHPAIWAEAQGASAQPPTEADSRQALLARAEELGAAVNKRWSTERIATAVAEAEAALKQAG